MGLWLSGIYESAVICKAITHYQGKIKERFLQYFTDKNKDSHSYQQVSAIQTVFFLALAELCLQKNKNN